MSYDQLEKTLAEFGLKNIEHYHWNYSTAQLYEAAIRRREGHLAHLGPLVTRTGSFTGRAPNDKFIVDEPSSRDKVWWGKINRPISEKNFDALFKRACHYLEGQEVFIQDCLAGADTSYELPIRVITEHAWHSLFARTMFIRPENFDRTLAVEEPKFTVLHVPHLHAMPSMDSTNSEAFVIINFGKGIVLIGGTQYAGEIKKSIFSVMNYLLPQQGVMSMHASANVDDSGSVAVFFGLSGTGKTTLSADPKRKLIGDDEHAWGSHGIFNLEGGCYAKVIRLSEEREPLIYATTRMFGTILENVGMDFRNRDLDLDDDELTENTRAAYPITHIPNAIYPGIAGHPEHVIMLTCDAFGVMPPVSRLSINQAMYHFISGYTAKVAGTEKGVTEPQAVFSTCFGAPFMSLHPSIYAKLLGEHLIEHNSDCWLINTGWSGGPYGVGERIDIHHTRAMLDAVLTGALDDTEMIIDPIFGLSIPKHCPGVPDEILDPRSTWSDRGEYSRQANRLAELFHENFASYTDMVEDDITSSGPLAGR